MALLSVRLEAKGAEQQRRGGGGGRSGASDTQASSPSFLVLFLELVLLFLLTAGSILVIFTSFRQNPDFMAQLATLPATERAQVDTMMQASQSSLLVVALIMGGVIVIGVLIYNLAMHYFSVFVLAGEGDFVSFLNTLLGVEIVSYLVTMIIYAVPLFVTRLPIGTQNTIRAIDSAIIPLASFGTLVATVYYVSKAERFGIGKGIVTVIVAPIAFGVLCFCCLFLLLSTSNVPH
jgi:hypothetical protein